MTTLSAPGPKPVDNEYGADEISALVLDPGYSVTRAGFAGEDTPKSVVSTYYGVSSKADAKEKLVFDDNAIYNPFANLEIRNPMAKDGLVDDWDTAAKLWEYSIVSRLIGAREPDSKRGGTYVGGENNGQNGEDVRMEDVTDQQESALSETPLLMTEPGWSSAKNREQAIELAMENWGCPAFWLGRSGVLAAFASGKPTALVIDVGASTMSVTPVHDGLMLRKGLQKSPFAGNYVSDQIRLMLQQSQPPIAITPHYMIASKTPVDAGAAAQASYLNFATPPHEAFRRLQEERVLTEFKESVVQVWNPALVHPPSALAASQDHIRQMHGRPFEMPDGWNTVFGYDRFRPVEALFDEKMALTVSAAMLLLCATLKLTKGMQDANTPAPQQAQTLPGMVQAALSVVDTDLRPHLLNNVVVTGGSSLLQGLTERVNHELSSMYPGPRVRLQAPANLVERKFAAWIGGSVLASLGSFHQMWISKKEYDEVGKNIVEKRCK